MADISLSALGKSFAGAPALHDITTTFKDGEFVALLGPSGCGKTTLLRLLAGFEMPTTGQISIGPREVAHVAGNRMVPPEDRNIGFVFQSYALWPHMNVRRNVYYPLEFRRFSKAEITAQTDQALQATGLTDYADRMPSELSGGQRQRIAIARALALRPKLIVADEAVSALDVSVQAQVLNLMMELQSELGLSYLFISHDLAVVRAMSHEVAVMKDGDIVEHGSAREIFESPKTDYARTLMNAALDLEG